MYQMQKSFLHDMKPLPVIAHWHGSWGRRQQCCRMGTGKRTCMMARIRSSATVHIRHGTGQNMLKRLSGRGDMTGSQTLCQGRMRPKLQDILGG